MNQKNNQGISQWLLGLIGCGMFAMLPAQAATIIDIINPGLEIPVMENELNTSFNGAFGEKTGVPGWSSNEASSGGAMHVDQWFPGRTGNNVMYLHGSSDQTFYTAGFDLGVSLASYTTYTLSFDVLRWYGWDGVTSITQDDYVIFSAGIYTGADYENRTALAELAGNFYLLDDANNPLSVKTVTLSFTTAEVAPHTTFWIGGSAYGNASDGHRATYDNFHLIADAIPEPSTLALFLLCSVGFLILQNRVKARTLHV